MTDYFQTHGKIIDFIHDTSKQLKLSILPRTTACIIYHKACRKLKKRHESIEPHLLASTCLYLSSKLDEEPQKIRDIVNISYRLIHPDEDYLEIGKSYWNLRDSITTCELMILRLFKFHVTFESPFQYLLHYIKLTEDIVENEREWQESQFIQICWNLLNDATYLPLIAECKPDLIATCVFYVALKITMLKIPGIEDDDDDSKKWFKIFCPSTDEEELESIGCELLQLYEKRRTTTNNDT